jgi:hypothetical protein
MLVLAVVYSWCQLGFHEFIKRFAISSNIPPNLHLPCKKNWQTFPRPPRPNMLAVDLGYARIQSGNCPFGRVSQMWCGEYLPDAVYAFAGNEMQRVWKMFALSVE